MKNPEGLRDAKPLFELEENDDSGTIETLVGINGGGVVLHIDEQMTTCSLQIFADILEDSNIRFVASEVEITQLQQALINSDELELDAEKIIDGNNNQSHIVIFWNSIDDEDATCTIQAKWLWSNEQVVLSTKQAQRLADLLSTRFKL